MESMRDFLKQINEFDDRIQLLEEWAARKEVEIKSRMVLPPKNLQKSDSQLHSLIEAKFKKARESIVSQFLIKDEFRKTAAKKNYDDLTTNELTRISESIAVRLNLFQGSYPAFMPQAVRAVMEHPNLSRASHDLLDSYCRLFELDWRGDRDTKNKMEYLSLNPVYIHMKDRDNFVRYGEVGNFEVKAMIKHACTPFLEDLAQSLLQE